jgi:hypothetical protein
MRDFQATEDKMLNRILNTKYPCGCKEKSIDEVKLAILLFNWCKKKGVLIINFDDLARYLVEHKKEWMS